MLINCPHCEASYRIDSSRIPEKDSFVRCTKCSKAIPISGKKEVQTKNSDTFEMIAECESCKSRYSVPLEMFKSDVQKLRCGKCGHTFRMRKDGKPFSEDEFQEETTSMDIPEPSSGDSKESATDKYLDSISLSAIDEDEDETEIELSSISVDQKSKFFLKPEDKILEDLGTESEKWPDILDETEMELSELDDMNDNLSSSDEEEEEEESSELMEIANPSGNEIEVKPKVQNKKKVKKKSKLGLVIFLFLIILLLIGLYYWDQNRKLELTLPSDIQSQEIQSKLSIREPLNGQYIKGKSRSKRLFLIEGWLNKSYPQNVKIRKIVIKGVLYGPNDKKLSESFSYAGKKLDLSQIEEWSDKKLQDYFQNALDEVKSKQLLRVDRPILFQIVFFGAPDNIQKLEARILSYDMDDQPITMEE